MADDQIYLTKKLPAKGKSFEDIKTHLESIRLSEPHARFARAFRATEDVQEVAKHAYNMFMSDNGFFSLYMPYMQQIEQEVVAMGVSNMSPEPDSTGNLVSGGTESNFSAIHAALKWSRDHRPNVKKPNIVAPMSIHPSFQKGAKYLSIDIIRTELDEDGRAIPEKIAEAINEDTIMVAASAPSWGFTLIDPITEIAAIAQKEGLWMHVDGCVGGYLSPFLEELGEPIPAWDFRVPGVMSISADLHKFGYALKPASTIFFRHQHLQEYHYVSADDYHLGPYKMAGLAGSRNAGPIFAAWAVMNYLGHEGYLRMTRRLLDLKKAFIEGLEEIGGFKVWKVDVMPMHFEATEVSTGAIYEGMSERGWAVLGINQPEAITFAVDPSWTDEDLALFLADLKASKEDALASGGKSDTEIRYA